MKSPLSEELRRLRVAAGLSIAELARRAATSRAAIHAYEAGTRSPSIETATRILEFLGHELEVVKSPD